MLGRGPRPWFPQGSEGYLWEAAALDWDVEPRDLVQQPFLLSSLDFNMRVLRACVAELPGVVLCGIMARDIMLLRLPAAIRGGMRPGRGTVGRVPPPPSSRPLAAPVDGLTAFCSILAGTSSTTIVAVVLPRDSRGREGRITLHLLVWDFSPFAVKGRPHDLCGQKPIPLASPKILSRGPYELPCH